MPIDIKNYNRIDYKNTPKILEVKNLSVSFKSDAGVTHAVRGVSFDLYKGETLCLVGESGCGKSTVCKTLMGILSNEAIVDGGQAIFEGEDLTKISEDDFHRIRGNKIGMIFQDPLSSLNPIMKVGKQIVETTLINRNIIKKKYEDLISEKLVAFKNAKTNYTLGKEKLLAEPEFFKADIQKKTKDAVYEMRKAGQDEKTIMDFEDDTKRKAKEKYKQIKKDNKPKIEALKKEYEAKKPELKKALAKRKKEAKKEIRKYALGEFKKYRSTLKDLNSKLKSCKGDEKKRAEIKELKAKAKDDFTSATRITRTQAKKMALKVMEEVGINQPKERMKQYPFEFSGGMRQRIVIAIALTANPEVLICDEPTTALDVTIQAQILELINKIKEERHMSIIFITHDLGVVANMADRVAVMYAGKVVEIGTSYEIFFNPKHPYTWALLSSIPDINSKEKLEAIPGTPPNLVNPPKGDAFAERNRYALAIDYEAEPPLYKLSDTHYASTWLLHEKAPKVEPPKIVEERIRKSIESEIEYERKRQ